MEMSKNFGLKININIMHIFNHIQFLNGLLDINLHIIVYINCIGNCHTWLNYKEISKVLIETYNYLIWIIVLTMSFKV